MKKIYGIERDWISDFSTGWAFAVLLRITTHFIPSFSIAIPLVMGLSIVGEWIVIAFIACFVEEYWFNGFILGFLTEKRELPSADKKRALLLITGTLIVTTWLLANFYFVAGAVYSILGGLSLLFYAIWDKIPTLNLNFHIANFLKSIGFSFYHIEIYAKIIAISAIMNTSSAFIAAFFVCLIGGYLVRWRKSLMAPIGLHQGFNVLLAIKKAAIGL